MFAVKLPANSVVASNCYIALNMSEYVSYFTLHLPLEVLYYNWSLLKAVKVLVSYIELFYVFMFNSNKPIKVVHLQKLDNQSMLTGALVKEMVNKFSRESKKTFGHLFKQETF